MDTFHQECGGATEIGAAPAFQYMNCPSGQETPLL
jgi:hypothetical protein